MKNISRELSTSIDSSSEFLQLRTMNETLVQENESLKQQLEKALSLTKELETVHSKCRELNSQVLDSNQKNETLQSRLKLSQSRITESDKLLIEKENSLRQLGAVLNDLKEENEKSKVKNESLMKQIESDNHGKKEKESEFASFMKEVSSVFGFEVSSYGQVVSNCRRMKEIEQKENNESKKSNNELVHSKLEKKYNRIKSAFQALGQENDEKTSLLNEKIEELESICNDKDSIIKRNENEMGSMKQEIVQMKEEVRQTKGKMQDLKLKMDQKINEKNQELNSIQELLDQSNARVAELKNRISSIQQQETTESNSYMQEISNQKKIIDELSKQFEESKQNINDLQQKMKSTLIQLHKKQSKNDKIRSKLRLSSKRIAEMDCFMQDMQMRIDSYETEMRERDEELDNLRLQLQAAYASHSQGEAAFLSQSQDNHKLQQALGLLESLCEEQRKEISALANAKRELMDTVYRQSQMINVFEGKMHIQNEKISEFEKSKNQSKIRKDQCDGNDLSLLSVLSNYLVPEFHEPLKGKLLNVLNSNSINPIQRVIACFQEVGKAFKLSVQPYQTKEEKLNQDIADKDKQLISLRNHSKLSQCLLQSMYYLIRSKKQSLDMNIDSKGFEQEFIDFASQKAKQLEDSLKENDLLDSQFMSMNFLFSGTYEDRRRALQEIAALGWDSSSTFNMFCLQLLINITQDQELQRLRNSLFSYKNDNEQVKDILGSANEEIAVSDLVIKYVQKYKKLKIKYFDLVNYCSQMQEKEIDIDEIENQRILCEQQANDIQNSQKTIAGLIDQIDTLTLSMKEKDSIIEEYLQKNMKLDNDIKQIQITSSQEISNLEKAIDEKVQQIKTLGFQLKKSLSDFEIYEKSHQGELDAIKTSLGNKLVRLQQSYVSLKAKKKKVEKSLNSKLKSIENESQDEMQKICDSHRSIEIQFEENLQKFKAEIEEKQHLSSKLSEELTNSEERNKELLIELSKLSMSKKSLELQVQSLTDQLKREIQLLNSQSTFKEMSKETKHQEEINSLRSRFISEKNSILSNILESFDSLNAFENEDIEEETALEQIYNIARNYRRMKAAQIML